MNKEKVIQDLTEIAGAAGVITEEAVLKRESIDYVGYRNWERYCGHYNAKLPICVVHPKDTLQVSQVIRYLNDNRIIVIPKTGGSSATAGLEVVDENTVVADLGGINKILDFSGENMTVTVQCGVALEYLESYLNKRGCTTGHYPQSLPMAQIGGLTATRSIGQFSTYYGGIEDLVVGLEAVLPNGEIVRIKNVPRRSAGPDIRHIFIGSEGALAVITEVTLKIFPYNPEAQWRMAYAVKDMKTGIEIIRSILTEGCKPAVVRLHDAYEAQADYASFVEEGECILLFIADGIKEMNEAIGKAVHKACEERGARAVGSKPLLIWLEHRNDLCNEMDDSKNLRGGLITDTCEISALWSEVYGIYERVIEKAGEKVEELVYFCGHSSHSYMQGTNIYFKFGFRAKEDDKENEKIYFDILKLIIEETLAVGGSMAHHHGVGKYRTKWIKKEHETAYPVLKALKDTFDPNHIMNAGTIFPRQ